MRRKPVVGRVSKAELGMPARAMAGLTDFDHQRRRLSGELAESARRACCGSSRKSGRSHATASWALSVTCFSFATILVCSWSTLVSCALNCAGAWWRLAQYLDQRLKWKASHGFDRIQNDGWNKGPPRKDQAPRWNLLDALTADPE